ncbi:MULTISPECIES: hypothetical protein [unclassified Caballeronia]|uniref:hypothetical protein n=1 Tax=unclassified Caballeronia TaxID=2646786 RepID=UPI0028603ED3|nr:MULTISPECIES: hypothetical protein [unclassified Caballeronia]MDR5774928.1 hypothetical protein [Caballeronia sp. LZ002]MDR5850364.1 hypothetical protein [Caballeronia sp. LZ003]
MIELVMKLGPWIVAGLVGAWAVFTHMNAKATVADTKQQAQSAVAAAKAQQQVAEDNLNARKTADVQADADAAKTAAVAAQERTDVENTQARLDDDAARDELLKLLHGSGADNPGTGQRGAGPA